MRIVFHHDPRGECVARIYRNDGVTMELPSYSRKWTVPLLEALDRERVTKREGIVQIVGPA